MTMNVRVKRYIGPNDVMTWDEDVRRTGSLHANGFSDPRDGYMLECEVIHPPSAKGRTVLVRLDEKDRDDLLLLLRREAIRARTPKESDASSD